MNLCPSQKLKGNWTFTVWLATVEANGVGEDLDAKPEWEEEVESSAEDPEASSGLCGTDQLISYIVCFAKAVELYQKKTQNCFGCGSPNHLIRDCPQDAGKITWKVSLNVKEGTTGKGGWDPQKPSVTQPVSPDEVSLSLKTSRKTPFLKPYPLTDWSGPENMAQVKIDGESSWALLDNGSTINSLTLEFIWVHSLNIGPLSVLSDSTLGINGLEGYNLTFGLCYHKGSGGRSQRLWWSSGPSQTRFYHLCILSTSCSGYPYHQ